MNLQEALTIGTKAEGTIKATYAELYDAQGQKLFSLQNKNAEYTIEDLERENGYAQLQSGNIAVIRTANPKTLVLRDIVPGSKTSKKIGKSSAPVIVEDVTELDMAPYALPVVKASVYRLDKKKLNPVTLTPEAKEVILSKILPRTLYYKLEVEYDVFKNGELGKTPNEHRVELLYEGYAPFTLSDYYEGSAPKNRLLQRDLYKKFKKQKHFLYSIVRIAYKYLNDSGRIDSYGYYPTEWVEAMKNGGMEAYIKMIESEKGYKWLIKHKKDFPEMYTNITLKPSYQDKVAAPYAKLAEIIKTGGTLYAKPVAFDWAAMDIRNATVEQVITNSDGTESVVDVNLNDAIEAAKEEMDKAKNVIYLAGASSLF